MHKNVLQ